MLTVCLAAPETVLGSKTFRIACSDLSEVSNPCRHRERSVAVSFRRPLHILLTIIAVSDPNVSQDPAVWSHGLGVER